MDLILYLSKEEVNKSIVIDDRVEGTFKLLPKNHTNVEGKIPYNQTLFAKIRQASMIESSFSLVEGFRKSGPNFRSYIACNGHESRQHSVVTFKKSDLKPDNFLKMTFKIKCQKCIEEVKNNGGPTQIPHPDGENDINIEFNAEGDSEIKNKFAEIASKVGAVLETAFRECLLDQNPLLAAQRNTVGLGVQVVQAINEVLTIHGTLTESTLPESRDIPMNLQARSSNSVPSSNGMSERARSALNRANRARTATAPYQVTRGTRGRRNK